MSRRHVVFLLLAVAAAAVCVRLGFWQLSRLEQRRARNALVAARMAEPPVRFDALPRDPALARLRRVRLSGRYDYAREVVLTNRSRGGSPGVNIVTPLRRTGTDTAVLVNRGWVYSPDGAAADLTRWREGDSATVVGWAEPYPPPAPGGVTVSGRPAARRRLDRAEMERHTGYPLAPVFVVLLGDSTTSDSVPPRLAPPALDEGPHLSYAMQWFTFGVIAVVGAAVFVAHDRGRRG